MLVLVVNNSLTPSLQLEGTIYSWKGRGPAVTTLLSPPRQFPSPRREGSSSLLPWIRQAVLLLVGAGRPWTTILWEKSHAAPMSSLPQDSVLPAPTFSRRCLKWLGKRPCLLVFHASSRRRFFYGTILQTVHRSLAMVARRLR